MIDLQLEAMLKAAHAAGVPDLADLPPPAARERLQEIGFEPPQQRTPDELSASLKVDSERVGAILKSIGFKPE